MLKETDVVPPKNSKMTVSLVIEQGYSCAEVGRRLGVSENNVNRWVRQYSDNKESASPDGLTREQLEAELKRLRKENKRLEMDPAVALLHSLIIIGCLTY